MRCKIFNLSLDTQHSLEGERRLSEFMTVANVKRTFASIANQPDGPVWSVLCLYEEGVPIAQAAPARQETHTDPVAPPRAESAPEGSVLLSGGQVRGIVALKKWRADQAAQEGVPLYMVAQNKWLEDIVRMPVKTVDDLAKVRGLGEFRVAKYGAKIVEVLNAASAVKRPWQNSSYGAARA